MSRSYYPDPAMEPRSLHPPALDLIRSARRLGIVLSGGSVRCAFQIGVLETLLELGVQPALCVAVSGGAWNGAALSAGTVQRLRHYWRTFMRMPYFDVFNLLREHSPLRLNEMHRRTFSRFVGAERLRRPEALPLWIGVTRLRDRQAAYFDARTFEDPLPLLLASNYLRPFYTHAPRIGGERYGDGGLVDNIPYEKAFAEGCDVVVLVTMKGESEGHLYRNPEETEHVIPASFRERTVVIRPRHRLPAAWTDRRWPVVRQTIEIGRLRSREVLLGERHPETEASGDPKALSALIGRLLVTRVLSVAALRRKRLPGSPNRPYPPG
jgi:predicted acylesterase/phospholipase RssA